MRTLEDLFRNFNISEFKEENGRTKLSNNSQNFPQMELVSKWEAQPRGENRAASGQDCRLGGGRGEQVTDSDHSATAAAGKAPVDSSSARCPPGKEFMTQV